MPSRSLANPRQARPAEDSGVRPSRRSLARGPATASIAEVLLSEARARLETRELLRAEELAMNVLEEEPKNNEALALLIAIHCSAGDLNKARKIVDDNPHRHGTDSSSLYAAMIAGYGAYGLEKDARELFDEYEFHGGRNPCVFSAMADAYLHDAEHTQAARFVFHLAHDQYNMRDPEIYLSMINGFFSLHQDRNARQYFKKALDDGVLDSRIMKAMVDQSVGGGRCALAELIFDEPELAAMLSEKDVHTLLRGFISKKRYSELLEIYERLPPALAGSPSVILIKAEALLLAGNEEQAMPIINEIIKCHPQKEDIARSALYLRGRALRMGGRNEESFELYSNLIKTLPPGSHMFPGAVCGLAQSWVALGCDGRLDEGSRMFLAEGLKGYRKSVGTNFADNLERSIEILESGTAEVERKSKQMRCRGAATPVAHALSTMKNYIKEKQYVEAVRFADCLEPALASLGSIRLKKAEAIMRFGNPDAALAVIDDVLKGGIEDETFAIYALSLRASALMHNGNHRESYELYSKLAERVPPQNYTFTKVVFGLVAVWEKLDFDPQLLDDKKRRILLDKLRSRDRENRKPKQSSWALRILEHGASESRAKELFCERPELDEAERLLESKHYAQLLDKVAAIVKDNSPRDSYSGRDVARLLTYRAYALNGVGKHREALELFDQLVGQVPTHNPIHVRIVCGLAFAYDAVGDQSLLSDEKRQLMYDMLHLHPTPSDIKIIGDVIRACEIFEKGPLPRVIPPQEGIDPELETARQYMSSCRYGDALEVTNRLISKKPSDDLHMESILIIRAFAYNGIGRTNDAAMLFWKLMYALPSDSPMKGVAATGFWLCWMRMGKNKASP